MSFNSDEKRIGQNLGLDISSDLDAFELDGGGFPYISFIRMRKGMVGTLASTSLPILMSESEPAHRFDMLRLGTEASIGVSLAKFGCVLTE